MFVRCLDLAVISWLEPAEGRRIARRMSRESTLLPYLLKAALSVLFAWLVAGSVERGKLAALLVLLILFRGRMLWREWLKAGRGVAMDGPGSSPRRRSRADIVSELVSLCVVLPGAGLLTLMLTSTIVSGAGSARGLVLAALAAHFAANLIPVARTVARVLVRSTLSLAVVIVSLQVAREKHPYLLTSGATHRRELAGRVWELGHSVEAGRYAVHLVDYGKDLEAERRWEDAETIYRRALELDAFMAEAHAGMARVQDARGRPGLATESRRLAGELAGVARRSRPTVSTDVEFEAPSLPRFDWQARTRLGICLVPVGEVDAALVNDAGARLARELGVEVYRWDGAAIPLPAAGRKSAVLGDRQWEPESLMRVFADQIRGEALNGRELRGPWQFLLVTEADLYLPDVNFVFAVSYPVHGVVSAARMGRRDDPRMVERLGKQLTATAIKCFGVRQADRPDCVTAYVRSVDELDRRPAGPSPTTRAEYRGKVTAWERDPRRPPQPPR